jgi:hypothetical protein
MEGDMLGFERAGWHLVWGNIVVFAIVCAITLAAGGLDASAAMIG